MTEHKVTKCKYCFNVEYYMLVNRLSKLLNTKTEERERILSRFPKQSEIDSYTEDELRHLDDEIRILESLLQEEDTSKNKEIDRDNYHILEYQDE